MLLDSFEESAGTNEVNPSSLLTSKSASSFRMLNALATSSRPTLVKYQKGIVPCLGQVLILACWMLAIIIKGGIIALFVKLFL